MRSALAMKNRSLFRCLLLVLALLPVAACSRIDDPAGTPQALRLGVLDEPDTLNPLLSHTTVAADIADLIFAPLFRYDARGELVPELAIRVPSVANGDISSDGRRITLHMRTGVRWADGAPLDARDLRFTWRAVMNPRNQTTLQGAWREITAIDLPNRYTAVIDLAHADATVLSLFVSGGDAAYPPLPAHLLAAEPDLNHVAFNALPLASGPWQLQRWVHGSELRFVANPRYWRGPPGIHDVRLVAIPNAESLVVALRSHVIDGVMNLPEEHRAEIAVLPRMTLITHAVATYRHLDFNCANPQLADPSVRLALIEAIDWPKLLQRVYHETGRTARSDIFPNSWAAPQITAYPYDPRAAARRLARLVRPLSLTIMSGTARPASQRAEVLMIAAWQRVGVNASIKNMPASQLFAEDGPLYRGRYDVAWMSDTRAADPDNSALWTSRAIPPHGANTVFLRDASIDHLAATARATSDRGLRRRLYQREEERLHALAPSLIAAWQNETIAFAVPITNVRPATYGSDFAGAWAWRWRR